MLTCRACLTKSFDSLYGGTHPKYLKTSYRNLQRLTRPNRSYATSVDRTPPDEPTDLSPAPYSISYGKRAPAVGRSVEWAARKELEYLRDPYHIANRVKDALEKDNVELALQITRESSRDTRVTVSWNNLIDYQIRMGRLNAAIKLYNEMKKRAQLPNAQTFTIILRGCAKSDHPKLAIGEAIKLYQNMFNGHIKPNTIHLNAVLQVCAKLEDIESMFSILKNSDNSLQSPNNLTYTTILNALRAKADKEPASEDNPGGLTEEQVINEKADAIRNARAIWDEVISRWRSGAVFIDEELVCAMGRVLLMGGYHDANSIEGLIYKTMLAPRKAKKAARNNGTKDVAIRTAHPVANPLRAYFKDQEPGEASREAHQDYGTNEVALVTNRPVMAPGAPAIPYAIPGRNSLSLILEALFKTRKTSKAIAYWNIFTIECGVVPDGDNWNQYLNAIRLGKNSRRAATILEKMPINLIRNQHIRHAMRTCLRDNLNRSALANASKILHIMGRVPSIPDVRALRTYLQVAHANKRSFDAEAKRDYKASMSLWAEEFAVALDLLFGAYSTLVTKCGGSKYSKDDSKSLRQRESDLAELVALERKMCAAYDILISEHSDVLTGSQKTKMRTRHAGITRRITAYIKERRAKRLELGGFSEKESERDLEWDSEDSEKDSEKDMEWDQQREDF